MPQLSVPIIDIGPYWGGGEAGKRDVAAAVDRACRDIGFLVISGHGIAPEMVEETREVARGFFDLPIAEKLRVGQPAPTVFPGHTPLARAAGGRARLLRSADRGEMAGGAARPQCFSRLPAAGKRGGCPLARCFGGG